MEGEYRKDIDSRWHGPIERRTHWCNVQHWRDALSEVLWLEAWRWANPDGKR